jgi:hypothetical protein
MKMVTNGEEGRIWKETIHTDMSVISWYRIVQVDEKPNENPKGTQY